MTGSFDLAALNLPTTTFNAGVYLGSTNSYFANHDPGQSEKSKYTYVDVSGVTPFGTVAGFATGAFTVGFSFEYDPTFAKHLLFDPSYVSGDEYYSVATFTGTLASLHVVPSSNAGENSGISAI